MSVYPLSCHNTVELSAGSNLVQCIEKNLSELKLWINVVYHFQLQEKIFYPVFIKKDNISLVFQYY